MTRHRNIAKLLARLNVASPNLAPRKGSSGWLEVWDRTDAATIAHALGAVGARSAGRKLAVTVLCMRWWPDSAVGPEVVYKRKVETVKVKVEGGRTVEMVKVTALIARTVRPNVARVHRFVARALLRKLSRRPMPEKILERVKARLKDGTLAASVLDEFVNPNHCPRCHGYGNVWRTTDDQGQPCAAHVATCSMCLGQGVVKRGVGRRAAAIQMRTADYHEYVQESFEAALGLLRYLESRAARDVARFLGD